MRSSGIHILMRRILLLWAGLIGIFAPLAVHAAHTDASLLLGSTTARSGQTVQAGIRLRMEPGWHTYWRNGGSAGIPTKADWTLPPGVTAGEIQWPPPKVSSETGFTVYIYEGEVVLPVTLTLAGNVPPGPLDLKAHVSWLECEKSCIPGATDIQATLNVGSESKPSPDAAILDAWQRKIPTKSADLAAQAWWEKPATGDLRPLVFEWHSAGSASNPDFLPYGSDSYEVQPKAELLSSGNGTFRLRKEIKKGEGNWPAQISGILVQQSGENPVAYEISLPIADFDAKATSGSNVVSASNPAPTAELPTSVWLYLVYAFIGGLILNVMPCVLPVIALKILGFVGQAHSDPRETRKLGLIYAAGVLASFLAFAVIIIALKSAGHVVSWGMQYQNPYFVLGMTILVTLVALNLFGVFEVTLSGRLMGAAGGLASKEGKSGAFFNGVLATALATPCTAAYLGYAVGFALAQPPLLIAVFFLTIGAGMALPYVVLSCKPEWLRFLPKPGVWMERFKMIMGFPVLATAVWLFTLAAPNYGEESEFWLGLLLVMIAMMAWLWGQFVQRGRSHKGLAIGVIAGVFLAAYVFVLEGELHWRKPVSQANVGGLKSSPDGIDWQPWSHEAVQAARESGHPVLVDFTARWCLTCQINKKTSLEVPAVRAKLKAINAVALIENSPVKDANIVAELNRYGRAGVPLVLVYPANALLPPEVLPDGYLTPGIVLSALDKAAQQPAPTATTANR